ncbi:hypothetical protein ACP4OV_016327 [Aristida adscensionis]
MAMVDEEAGFDSISLLDDPPEAAATAAKFRPKQRGPKKPRPVASSTVAAASPTQTTSLSPSDTQPSPSTPSTETLQIHELHDVEGTIPDDTPDGLGGEKRASKLQLEARAEPTETVGLVSQEKSRDQENTVVSDTQAKLDASGTDDFDSYSEMINAVTDGEQFICGDPSAEPTVKSQPVATKKGNRKSVSFAPSDTSEIAEVSNFSRFSSGIVADENLNNLPQQSDDKHSNDEEFNDTENQGHEKVLSDHAVEERQSSVVGETGSSVKLRSREKMKKFGISEHIVDDSFNDDCTESLVDEQDNDSDLEYTIRGIQEARKKPRKKGSSEEPSTGKKRTRASSGGRQRKDASTEKPEKKLTHRIRHKRMKEVKALLDTPEEEIDRKKLSAMHLRLLQEATERIKGKEIPSQRSSNNQSSQFGEYEDDFEHSGDAGLENGDNGRENSDVLQNETKLNYHSYMATADWAQQQLEAAGLRQFGTDFAMIKQLFPDKTRDQIRQKFKSEERKNPMQVHDAILQRSRDNSYFKKVIKELNIEDVQLGANTIKTMEGASKENVLDDSIIAEDKSNWSENEDRTHSTATEEADQVDNTAAKEVDQVSENVEPDLDSLFDWY